ncbi:MAG TPA: penicillin-binding transpeptidase domain-containing protein, partial [Rhizorhapis sp.]|nr:penicillin-binding transpeptidase domain-containing protein [Rhizorhapis sp.]
MAQPIRIAGSGKNVTEASQSFTFTRRAMVLGGIQGGIGVLLAVRMGWISIAENEHYELLSESNRVNLTLIPPRRGWIIDRHGKPLANNRTDFRVDIIPDRLHDKDATVASLAELLSLDPEEVQRIKEDLKKAAGFQPVQVADKLDYAQYAAVSVRLPELPGVAPARGFSRNYPAGAAVGHLIGYVGAASAEDYEENKDPLLITPGFKIGKDGLEKAFDKVLTGKPGAKRVEVTARGKVVRELTTRPDTPGHVVRLTIDAGLQHYAARRLGAESGSVVVMDCLTGDVLTLASMPSYDPNSFSDGIGHLEWNMLAEDDHVPLRNKTLQGLYPPGSTVKPMVALS